jgi:plasmid stabilization system protein ParE
LIWRLTRQAKADIEAIIRYTDRHFGPAQTAEYVGGLYYSFEVVGDNPRMGREWDGGKFRYIYRMHVVHYRILSDHILITHIRHGSQCPS